MTEFMKMFTTGGEETRGAKAPAQRPRRAAGCRILLYSFLAGDATTTAPSEARVCRCQILPHNFRIFHLGVGFQPVD